MRNRLYLFLLFSLFIRTEVLASSTDLNLNLFVYDEAADAPAEGTATVRVCDSPNGGTCYCSEVQQALEEGLLISALECTSDDISNLPTTSYVQVEVGGSLIASPEIQGVPFALIASRCDQATSLAPGNLTITGDLTVTGGVTAGGAASGDITGVTAGSGLTGGGTSGDVTITSVLGTTIETSEITDGTITTADFADSAVTTAKIADGTIAAADIASDAVEAAEIATGAVTTTEILDGAIAAGDVGDDVLNFAQLNDALELDASTTITVDNAEVLTITNTGTGNSLVVNDEAGDLTPFQINNAGEVGIRSLATAGISLDVNGTVRPTIIQHRGDTQTIADNGLPTTATLTLDPASSFVSIECNDANGCDITMSEASAQSGQIVTIVANVGAVNMSDTADVSELAGAFGMGVNDSITLIYLGTRWLEITRSNN